MGQERWSSIWDGRRRPPLAAYPRLGGAGRALPPICPCSGWGLPCHHCYQWCGGLLPHRFTLTRISGEPSTRAVSFLWPYPSPCGAQALPGSLPCGARTFLEYLAAPATIRPTSGLNIAGKEGRGEAGKCREADLFPLSSWNSSSYFSRLLPRLPHSRESPLRLLQKWEQCRIGSLPLRQHLAVLFPRFGSAAQSLVSGTPEEPYPAQHPPT